MLIIGDKEAESGSVSVRTRSGGDMGSMPLDELHRQGERADQVQNSGSRLKKFNNVRRSLTEYPKIFCEGAFCGVCKKKKAHSGAGGYVRREHTYHFAGAGRVGRAIQKGHRPAPP
jgi:hypothetical protein